MQKSNNIVAYFDFDGTVTYKDTLLPFLLHCVGWLRFIYNLPRIIPVVVLYLLKIITNEEAKQRTLIILLNGYTFQELDRFAKSFAYSKISKYIKPEIFAKLEYHKEHFHKVILVSANLAIYLRYWANIHQIDDVIATEIEFINNLATGRLATRNCYGIHKVFRINKYLKDNNISFDYSYAYGNSKGDYELLNYVDEGYWIEDSTFRLWESVD